MNAGKEFNPLAEIDENGHQNPYQDPSRGRLDLVTVDPKGGVRDATQEKVLINLSGFYSVIGRSILIYDQTVDDNNKLINEHPLGCCVIGIDRHSTWLDDL